MLAAALIFFAFHSLHRPLLLGWGTLTGAAFLLSGLFIITIGLLNPVDGYKQLPYPNNLQLIDPSKPVKLVSYGNDGTPNQISIDERVMMLYPQSHYLTLTVTIPKAFDALQGLWRGREGVVIVDGLQRGKYLLSPGNATIEWHENIQRLERKVSPNAEINLPLNPPAPASSYDDRTLIVRLSMNIVYPDTNKHGDINNEHKILKHQFQILFITPEELTAYRNTHGMAIRLELLHLLPYIGPLLILGFLLLVISVYTCKRYGIKPRLLPEHKPAQNGQTDLTSDAPTLPTIKKPKPKDE